MDVDCGARGRAGARTTPTVEIAPVGWLTMTTAWPRGRLRRTLGWTMKESDSSYGRSSRATKAKKGFWMRTHAHPGPAAPRRSRSRSVSTATWSRSTGWSGLDSGQWSTSAPPCAIQPASSLALVLFPDPGSPSNSTSPGTSTPSVVLAEQGMPPARPQEYRAHVRPATRSMET